MGSNRSSQFVVAGFLRLQPTFSCCRLVAKRSRPFTDEVSKYTGASSKSKPKRQKSFRAGCSATSTELTVDLSSRIDAIRCQARRIQARHRVTDCISQVLPGIQRSRNQKRQNWKVASWMPERQQNASSSSGRDKSHNPNAGASGRPSAVPDERR